MRRRDLINFFAGAIGGFPSVAFAQRKAGPTVGFLHSLSAASSGQVLDAFREGLSKAGYREGQNVAIEYRWAEGKYDLLPGLAADLVSRGVDVIMTGGGTPSAVAAKHATSTIPIVFALPSDPIGSGLVASWARPAGNATGISAISLELNAKRLELLSDLVPRARLIALLVNPNFQLTPSIIRDVQEAARAKGLPLQIVTAGNAGEVEAGFAALAELHADALVVGPDPFFYEQRQQIAAFASRHAVPAIYELDGFVAAGGLISYGTSLTSVYRQCAAYVGRILGGATPADLPVQQPTQFDLVLNMKTAKALGLTVPPSIMARVDRVIE
jgi:putative ABC transport system substrate-binding protein